MIEPGLRQNEFVRAAQIGELAAEQPRPRQRLRVTGDRVGHRLVEPGQRGAIGRQVDLAVLHPFAQQRERGEQPARARVLGQLPEKGLGVDGPLEQRLELFGIEKQQALPAQKGRGIGPADGAEMRMVRRQRRGQAGGGRLGLLRLLGVDHRHQQIGKLRELGLEGHGPLAPRQAFGEHFVGIGADAEMAGRIEAGEPAPRPSAATKTSTAWRRQ